LVSKLPLVLYTSASTSRTQTASKDALVKISIVISIQHFSKLMKSKAAIPDAEEAIPELCGNVFCVSIVK
jgi:hypothetical protein